MLRPESRLPQAGGGYADLLRALQMGGEESLSTMAALLGFVQQPPPPPLPEKSASPVSEPPTTAEPVQPKKGYPQNLAPLPLWRLQQFEAREPLTIDNTVKEEGKDTRPHAAPNCQPLFAWNRLAPRLRQRFTELIVGRDPDFDKIIARISRGQELHPIPCRLRRRWGRGVQIILDRSQRLAPLQADLDQAAGQLARLFPHRAVEYAMVWEQQPEPLRVGSNGQCSSYQLPEAGTLVVVLGDMGFFAAEGSGTQRQWQRLGHRLQQQGCRTMVLNPCPEDRWLPERLPSWTMLPLLVGKRGAPPTAEELQARAERLLCHLSPAIRIEPGLLRAVRALLGTEADHGTEVDAWNHPAMAGRNRVAGVLHPQEAERLRQVFAGLELARQQAVVLCLQQWRSGLDKEIWFEELLKLQPEQLPESIRNNDWLAAKSFFMNIVPQEGTQGDESLLDWFVRVDRRASADFYQGEDQQLRLALQRLNLAALGESGSAEVRAGFDLRLMPKVREQPLLLSLSHQGKQIILGDAAAEGSLLGAIRSCQDKVLVGRVLPGSSEAAENFWQGGKAPSWADAWGWDTFGAWVEFVVGEVRQRMRWIPAGSFMMGSPESELERNNNEGPQHRVSFHQGYWLFDTTCTQALWQVVMGENPSRFRSPDRPVESVNFMDVQKFLRRIGERLSRIDLTLPNEAQWEYACRANTHTAYNLGDSITKKQINFDSMNGTVPVASLPPNPWGLYEMHGNIWEWCQDSWHNSYEGAPNDGSTWHIRAAMSEEKRVIRGGSWRDSMPSVQTTTRSRLDPRRRNSYLGFRCVRMPISQASGQVTEPQLAVPEQQLVYQTTRSAAVAATLLDLQGDAKRRRCQIPGGYSFQVQSDSETLTFTRYSKPSWAEAIGRDRYGLWVSFTLPGESYPPVSQKLRWIPPGRFMMGSPEEEPGREQSEGPQHEVTLRQGFWLFDTPCTQALWQAVMGNNPSRFRSAFRPVEAVSFDDANKFIDKINEKLPGLSLFLPSEAQWEYACRAGTSSALYTGPLDILGENSAPALEKIAWYGGNSGLEFDLKNGVNSHDWPEKYHPHQQAGSHPVALQEPNGWGLYDMLGNVREWCADVWQPSYQQAPLDGSAWPGAGEGNNMRHCKRGGAWIDFARCIRAAYRSYGESAVGNSYTGFRCARLP